MQHDYVSILTALSDLRHEVRNYKANANNTQWSFSCLVCGDSMRDRRKARFNVSRKGNDFVCHCYNCGYSAPFVQYLRAYHPDKYQLISTETFKSSSSTLFDVNSIVQRLTDQQKHKMFYIDKFENAKLWLQYLANKKITLNENNARNLYNIHRSYWSNNGNRQAYQSTKNNTLHYGKGKLPNGH